MRKPHSDHDISYVAQRVQRLIIQNNRAIPIFDKDNVGNSIKLMTEYRIITISQPWWWTKKSALVKVKALNKTFCPWQAVRERYNRFLNDLYAFEKHVWPVKHEMIAYGYSDKRTISSDFNGIK